MSSIEWTQVTWNPTTGCDKISPGCGLPRFEGDATGGCYAMAMAKRLKAMGSAKYQSDGDPRTSGPGFGVTVHPDTLGEPLRWREPKTVFVNSMSDLFHAKVSREFVTRVWAVMAATPQHCYQVLTKRPERMARMLTDLCGCGRGHAPSVHFRSDMDWVATPHSALHVPGVKSTYHTAPWPLDNVWLGASVELDEYTVRVDHLRATPAAVRFVSAEPLLGSLPTLDLTGIDWLIIGGESGPGARPMQVTWVRDLIDRARASDTAVFVKQLGPVWARDTRVGGQPVARTDPKGGNWANWPDDLRIREYPARPGAEAVNAGAA